MCTVIVGKLSIDKFELIFIKIEILGSIVQ